MTTVKVVTKEDDSEWTKTVDKRVIMHKSEECERIRRICRMHNGNTYPPVEVTNIFEHLRGEWKLDQATLWELMRVFTLKVR